MAAVIVTETARGATAATANRRVAAIVIDIDPMHNSFGHLFRLTSFGESHGPAIGGIVDGCPPGITIDQAFIQQELDRRRPGTSVLTTSRNEADKIQLLSGVFEGKSTGAPIAFLVANENTRSQDYQSLQSVFRPSHADYTYFNKYGLRDHRGGGRSSARETIARVVAGAIAKLALKPLGVEIEAFTCQIGNICLAPSCSFSSDIAKGNRLHCPDNDKAQAMEELIISLRQQGDSVGGVVHCSVKGVPVGWGEPHAQKLSSMLAASILSIPACKGFDYGSGFDVSLTGSKANDAFFVDDTGRVRTRSNHSGGIQGGISNGEEIYFRAAFKPIASISQEQETVDQEKQSTRIRIQGRHDPCVLPRALPVVEAMTAMTLLDAYLLAQSRQAF